MYKQHFVKNSMIGPWTYIPVKGVLPVNALIKIGWYCGYF